MCRRFVRVAGYRIVSKCFYAFLFRRPRGEKYRTAMLHSLSPMLKLVIMTSSINQLLRACACTYVRTCNPGRSGDPTGI